MLIKKLNIFVHSSGVFIKRGACKMHKREIWKEQDIERNVERTELGIRSERVEFGWSDETILWEQEEVP